MDSLSLSNNGDRIRRQRHIDFSNKWQQTCIWETTRLIQNSMFGVHKCLVLESQICPNTPSILPSHPPTMCITTERNSTVCGHRASFTALCKKATSTSIVAHFLKCSPVLNSTYHFDLCHDCRHLWRNQGVDETKAMARTREYRTDHNYYAPLSPARVLANKSRRETIASVVPEPLRFEREENASTVTLWSSMADTKLGTSLKPLPREPGQQSKRKGKGIDTSVHPLTCKADNSPDSTTMTLWPRMFDAQVELYPEILPQSLPQAHLPPGTADSNRTGLETIIVCIESDEYCAASQDFELGNTDRPLPLNVRRAKSGRMQPKPELDLDKPLPRPPRCDSPMPGRLFDSQNPEKYLTANKYYPRFI
jgi:hypothetical protein